MMTPRRTFPRRALGGGGGGSSALDGLSGAALTSLRAAWWTKRLLTSYGGTLYDARHLYDQSGNNKTLASAADIGTTTEGSDTALVLDAGVPNNWTRGDALGLAADPALTIVWKMRCTNGAAFPGVISLGSLGSAEFNIWFNSATNMWASNFAVSASVSWINIPDIGASFSTFVLTKSAGSGYNNGSISAYRDGVLLTPGSQNIGPLALGNNYTLVGDYDGFTDPFAGHLAGMLIFERELSGADLALVQGL